MNNSKLTCVILAAGYSTRFRSAKNKVLWELAGKSIIAHIHSTLQSLHPEQIIVVHNDSNLEGIQAQLQDNHVEYCQQTKDKGTGAALKAVLPFIHKGNKVLVCCGDTPLLNSNTLQAMVRTSETYDCTLLIAKLNNPKGFGRILRDHYANVIGIVEEKDATVSQQQIQEINSGVYVFSYTLLKQGLQKITNDNTQKEFYLTDIIGIANDTNKTLHGLLINHSDQIMGINTKEDLMRAYDIYQEMQRANLINKGVVLFNANEIHFNGDITAEQDTIITGPCTFLGKVVLETEVTVSPHTIIQNATIRKGAYISSFNYIHNIEVQPKQVIKPFSHK